MENVKRCSICERTILGKFSKCGICRSNYQEIKSLIEKRKNTQYPITDKQVMLYLALKSNGLEPVLEYKDKYDKDNNRYKTVDIALLKPKIFIEVNGQQHVNKHKQLISDLWRTHYSFNEGYLTLNVFNLAMEEGFHEIVATLVSIALERSKSIAKS